MDTHTGLCIAKRGQGFKGSQNHLQNRQAADNNPTFEVTIDYKHTLHQNVLLKEILYR